MPSSAGASAPPQTIEASDAKRRMPSNAAACWPRVTTGPMRVSAARGSPTLVALSLAASASATASACAAATKMRRIAVHFCPAFTVISRTTSRTKASKAAPPARRAGRQQRRVDAVGLDVHRHALGHDIGMAAHARAVSAEPVNATTSSEPSASRRSPAPPQIRLSAPVRQHLGRDHVLHHGMRQERG